MCKTPWQSADPPCPASQGGGYGLWGACLPGSCLQLAAGGRGCAGASCLPAACHYSASGLRPLVPSLPADSAPLLRCGYAWLHCCCTGVKWCAALPSPLLLRTRAGARDAGSACFHVFAGWLLCRSPGCGGGLQRGAGCMPQRLHTTCNPTDHPTSAPSDCSHHLCHCPRHIQDSA